MTDSVFIDTNVLVYAADPADPVKRHQARAVIAALASGGRAHVSTQVLQELFVALTRGSRPITNPERARSVVAAAAELAVVQITTPAVFEAIDRARRLQLSFWDALIVGAARSAKCTRILSEDLNPSQTIDGVRIENPFAHA